MKKPSSILPLSFLGILLGFPLGAAPARAEINARENPTGLKTGVAIDLVGETGDLSPAPNRNQFFLREAELNFLAPIDTRFDGVLNANAHREAEMSDTNADGVVDAADDPNYAAETVFEIHEVYLGSTKLIPRSRFKLGRFQVGLGRLQRFHRHDWPIVSAPLINDAVFGEEAYFDNGAEYSVLLPLPFYLDWTLGLTDGSNYGRDENDHFKSRSKFKYSRLATYFGLGETGGAEIAANYAHTKNDAEYSVFGADATFKWKEGKFTRFLLQTEYWNRKQEFGGGAEQTVSGFYVFPQYGFDETFSLGVRFDSMKVDNDPLSFKESVRAIVPQLTVKSSEFARFTLAYTHQNRTLDADPTAPAVSRSAESKIELQAMFILGTHPAHEF